MSTPVASSTDISAPRLGLNSKEPLNLVKNMPGYNTSVFHGKEEQRALVETEVASKV
jgi:glutamate dehydrogenase